MANTSIMTTFTYLMVFLLSLSTIVIGQLLYESDSGKIHCEPQYNHPLCQLRLTMYDGHWLEVNNVWYNTVIDAYDAGCQRLSGNGFWALQGRHYSVTSGLPWTVEVQLPSDPYNPNYIVDNSNPARYAGHGLLPSSTHMVWTKQQGMPWGALTSALFGFEC